ncbi:MAG: GAF domain-containing protein [Chloroflexi bacterium]|nr:GAF domain-containing protein [Chloroflexota bacterium]MCI0580394.1 GAF domain-containing protein [Chloroflexota bacterium]MCI0649687.1 GAF domain-containing protein [Chloroflexota bacterium]
MKRSSTQLPGIEDRFQDGNERLAGLKDRTAALTARLELVDLLEAILRRAGQLLNTADGYICVAEPDTEELEIRVATGVFTGYIGRRIRAGNGIAGQVGASGQTLLVEELDRWPDRSPLFPSNLFHTAVGAPLTSGPVVIGVLCLAHTDRTRSFTANEVELLSHFANLSSLSLEIALDNVRLYQSARQELAVRQKAEAALVRESGFLKLLQVVAVAANEATAIEDVLQFVLDQICQHTGWPVGHVYLTNEKDNNELISTTLWHLNSPERFEVFRRISEATRFPAGVGLPGRVLASGRPEWLDPIPGSESFPRARLAQSIGIQTGFAFPVLVGQEVVAVMEFFADQEIEPDENLLAVMGQIGTQLGRVVERQQAEKALRESEMKFRSLVQSANAAIVIADGDGRIVSWNPGAQNLFGYLEEEIVDKPLVILMPERYRQPYQQGFARLKQTGKSRLLGKTIEMHGLRQDGTEFPLELSLDAWQAGGIEFYSGIIRDITERKRAAEALRRAHTELEIRVRERTAELEIANEEKRQTLERLQKRTYDLAILNQAGQMLTASLDQEQIVNQLLAAVTEIIGAEGSAAWLCEEKNGEQLVCRAVYRQGALYSIADLCLPVGQGVIGRAVQEDRSLIFSPVAENPHYVPDVHARTGFEKRTILAIPMRVRDKVIGVLEVINKEEGFSLDDLGLAETLAASAAIAIDNARLVDTLRHQTSDLEARNEELDAFAHTVAHDLRNPLNQVLGFVSVLQNDLQSTPPEDAQRYLQFAIQGAGKMRNIIDELLLLAGVRKTSFQMEPLDMARIVTEAQQRLADMVEKSESAITLPDEWPVALGYAPWVEEVWVNYLSNALKYGGSPPRIEIGVTPQGDQMLRFWVRDNGPGIPAEEQERLFVPFTRLSQVRTEGHGLGLSIVQRIVTRLGGEVGVESVPGQGSTFYFTLPCYKEPD